MVAVLPAPQVHGCLGEHPLPDLDDEPGLLGERDDGVGWDDPTEGMSPPEKRFYPRDPPVSGRHDTDARAHLHLDTRKIEGCAQRRVDPRRERLNLRRVIEVFAQDDELISSEARQGVAGRSSSVSRAPTEMSNSSPTW